MKKKNEKLPQFLSWKIIVSLIIKAHFFLCQVQCSWLAFYFFYLTLKTMFDFIPGSKVFAEGLLQGSGSGMSCLSSTFRVLSLTFGS